MEEYLDILNESYEVIGKDTRKNIHENGLLHAAFQCWFYTMIDGKPYILFQKRNAKVSYPSLLDITVGGHLRSGEGPREGSREIEEEVGIDVQFEDLQSLGAIRDTLPYKQDKLEYELCHVYAYSFTQPFENIRFQEEEVESIVCIALEDFKKMVENATTSFEIETKFYDGNGLTSTTEHLSIEKDFVPHSQAYYQYIYQSLTNLIK